MSPRTRVLVVEDDPALRKVLELRLGLEGFAVTVAVDGRDGVDKLRGSHPEVVVTDLMMPRLDGFGFCREARRTPGCEDVPIVVLTARQRDGEIDELLEMGNIEFMPKPFDAPALTAALRRLSGVPHAA